jgi:hypothetical protein
VLQGRCLPYGEGITFFPIREIVEQAADLSDLDRTEESLAKVAALLDGEDDGRLVAERIGATLGISSTGASQEETFWAVRKLLDLIEHVAERSRDAAILLLCPSRLELLDARPGWGDGKRNATRSRSSRSPRRKASSSSTTSSVAPASRRRPAGASPPRRKATRCSSRRPCRCSSTMASSGERMGVGP